MIGCPRYVFSSQDYKNFKHLEWVHAGGAGIESFLSKEFKKSKITQTEKLYRVQRLLITQLH